LPEWKDRTDFITVGNGNHAPNVDAIQYLSSDIWPRIREQLPNAQVRNYGAYAPRQIQTLHNPKIGFHCMGWIPDLDTAMQSARICLAPLRFGAGLKGKIIIALQNGTPVVTTGIGAEGFTDLHPEGAILETPEAFANSAVAIYKDQGSWEKTVTNGFNMLDQQFQKERCVNEFEKLLHDDLLVDLDGHRKAYFIGQILQHQTLHSHRYMSKWIQEKNKSKI
jgi:glycosyltransferase involved in cell wall biosynthesis